MTSSEGKTTPALKPGMEEFLEAFLKEKGLSCRQARVAPIAGDGSQRLFLRAFIPVAETSLIIMAQAPDTRAAAKENLAYLMIGRHLHGKGVNLPEIYHYDLKKGLFLMEDMGTDSLQDLVEKTENPLHLYENVLEQLLHLQSAGADGFDPSWCCQTARYDKKVMLECEAKYFRDAFLGLYLGMDTSRPELDAPFNHLGEHASRARPYFFLHRDFQSRNIMIRSGRVGFIDWQGGRLGPLGYDPASLIIDPYTSLDMNTREALYASYLGMLSEKDGDWADDFQRSYPYLCIQRNLQILGAFAFLSRKKEKKYFERYIPRALETLRHLLERIHDPALSALTDLVAGINAGEKTLDTNPGGG